MIPHASPWGCSLQVSRGALLASLLLALVGCTTPQHTQQESGSPPPVPASPPPAPALGGPLVDEVVQELGRPGISSARELLAAIDEAKRRHVRASHGLFRELGDLRSTQETWSYQVEQQMEDIEAAWENARTLLELGQGDWTLQAFKHAEAMARRTSDPNGAVIYYADLLPLRCRAYWAVRKLPEARTTCELSRRKSRDSAGPRTLAKVLLVQGEAEQALRETETALELYPWNGATWYVRGVILSTLGRSEEAKRAWTRAVTIWPDFTPAHLALRKFGESPALSVEAYFAEEERWERNVTAAKLARCGHMYEELQRPASANECYLHAERLAPGSAAVEQLAHRAETEPGPAEHSAQLRWERTRNPEFLGLLARLALARKETEKAFGLLEEAVRLEPGSPTLYNTFVRACAGRREPRCAPYSRMRPAVGAYTEERHPRPGYQMDSRFMEKPLIQVKEFTLQPLDDLPLPEAEGLVEVLSRRFPGFTFRLAPPLPLPAGILGGRGGEQVITQYLMSKLPQQPGLIALLTRDMATLGSNYNYGLHEFNPTRGAVSVSRFRHPEGEATAWDLHMKGDALRLSRERFHNQVTSTVAKAVGMSSPCREKEMCVLRFARGNMQEFDAKGGEFCPKHRAELEALPR